MMSVPSSHFVLLTSLSVCSGWVACSAEDGTSETAAATGGTAASTGGALVGSGGSAAATGGMLQETGGASAGGAMTSSGGTGGVGTGGAGTGGSGSAALCEGAEPLPMGPAFDCGSESVIFQNAGRADNRINYIIVGDGYTQELLETEYIDHIENMLEHEDGMFGDIGEPYRRYRNFINICGLLVASQDACVDDLDTGLQCETPFNGNGDDASRLGRVDGGAVRDRVGSMLPDSIDADWIAVTINAGADNWWNSGGSIMVWNGGFQPSSRAASVALHEGGHSFHRLADEYDGTSGNCSSAPEVNVSTNGDGADWSEWLGFDHNPGSGMHGSYEGARYCNSGVYRPTDNSEMNLLPDYFNMPSIQKMIHDFYEIVRPIDAHTDNASTLVDPAVLQVKVVDPEVLAIEWSVDGAIQTGETGPCFDVNALAPGEHTVEARAYDDTEWVRDDRADLEQTVSWAVVVSGE